MLISRNRLPMFGPAVVVALAFLSGCAEHPHGHHRPLTASDCDYPRSHFIWVFDDGSVTEECAAIQWKKNQIVWRSVSDAPTLAIDLVVRKGQKQPFERMQCGAPDSNGDRVCRLDCKKDSCRTGPFKSDYAPDPRSDYYTYVAAVTLASGATMKGGDPGMRIDP